MKRYKQFFKEEITKEMEDWFNKRTNKHIQLVKKYAELILKSDLIKYINKSDFVKDICNHDQSKFIEPERTPYIYISWDYHCKDLNIPFEISEDMKKQMQDATDHHVWNNPHHPEFYDTTGLNGSDPNDRDNPSGNCLNCTSMPLIYIASMCADWMAMSEEKGNSPQEWAKKNVNIRWGFTKEQEDFIYLILNTIWK